MNLDIGKLDVAVVLGDDIKDCLDEIIEKGCDLNNMETGEPIKLVKDKLLSANVYFGAMPIVEALEKRSRYCNYWKNN